MIIISKFSNILKFFEGEHESFKNLSNIRSLLHGDNSKLILLIYPDKECLIVVMENTSIVWPVSIDATSLKESITFFEKEVISNQLILLCCSHCSEAIILSCQLSIKCLKCFEDITFNLCSLLWSVDSRSKWISIQVSSNSNSSTNDHLSFFWWEIWCIECDRRIFSNMFI